MKTAAEIQQEILDKTGIKTSVKKGKGTSKQYLLFSPIFQNGSYPQFPFEWRQNFLKQYPDTEPQTASVCGTQISLHVSVVSDVREVYKKERKPKSIEEMSVKTWGSKNSQLRLDKATARNAKKLRAGTTARYY